MADETNTPVQETPPAEANLTPQTPATDNAPMESPPRPGSARERMFQDLERHANPQAQTPEKEEAPANQPEEEKPKESEEEFGEEKEKPKEDEKPSNPELSDKPKRVSPWKLVDEWKTKHAALEKQLAEAGKNGLAEEERQQFSEKLQALESRNKELENEIKFVDYAKSSEFAQQYQKPYEAAWERALTELKELTVSEGGQDRPINAQDILQLVQLPLAKARETADDKFGVFADDVMQHRKEIKRLFEAQADALNKAKEDGGARLKAQQEAMQQQQAEIGKKLSESWKTANDEIVKDENFGRFFQPVEGDEELNTRLTRGYELVDKAFAENPTNPNLSADDRDKIVRRHAAVRHRAAAFGRLVQQVKRYETEIASLKGELGKIKGMEPSAAGGRKAQETPKPGGKMMDRMMAELEQVAGR